MDSASLLSSACAVLRGSPKRLMRTFAGALTPAALPLLLQHCHISQRPCEMQIRAIQSLKWQFIPLKIGQAVIYAASHDTQVLTQSTFQGCCLDAQRYQEPAVRLPSGPQQLVPGRALPPLPLLCSHPPCSTFSAASFSGRPLLKPAPPSLPLRLLSLP